MKVFSYVIIILLLIVFIIFGMLNASPVAFNYYLGKLYIPLSLLLFISFLVGACLGWLIEAYSMLKLRCKNWQLKKSLAKK